MKSNPRIAAATLSLALLMLAPAFALAQKQKKDEKRPPAQRTSDLSPTIRARCAPMCPRKCSPTAASG